ncbi:cyclodeaminase/cyclohydrolase family protein [Helcococcus bovis]|uniref:cyclodeaminase/cyclohydrolase family protein n=1 Tax=Helcococcus bovis TaxID=3153252 RepID=UPI0038BBB21E
MYIEEYLENITEVNHKAGGGSVAAFNGALAASLMIKAYNMAKKSNPEVEQRLGFEYYQNLQNLKNDFTRLVTEDGEIFGKVLEAYKLPKETREDRHYRREKIQETLKGAIDSPFEIIIKALKLFENIFVFVEFSNPVINSEIAVAKNQLIASIESAMVNMKVNIKAIDDKEYKIKKQNSILKIYQNLEYNKKKLQNFLERNL